MSSQLKIAVTGSAGYIGKNLHSYLCRKNYTVFPLVRSEKNNPYNKNDNNFRYGDVTDIDSLENAFKDIDIVIHLAALFNNPESTWADYFKVNVDGTKNVLSAALKSGVKKVIHCSTVGVATGSGKPPFSEKTPYSPPKWDKYEVTKTEAEKLAVEFSRKNNLNTVIIRPAQVYGPGDVRKSKFYRMIKKGYVVNPGSTLKHPIYIEELCRAFEIAMNTDTAIGEAFIIADQKPVLLKDMIKIIAEKLGVSNPKIKIPAGPVTLACTGTELLCNAIKVKPPLFRRSMDFFTKSVAFEVNKASDVLNFRGEVDISTGVDKTIQWYKQNGLL